MSLIRFTKKGLYCQEGGFYIDPWRKVKKAIITHGHSDHARTGMDAYLTAEEGVAILKSRLGNINVRGIPYGSPLTINGVEVTLFPAGHILGSAQVRVRYKDEIWVISGDYKTEDDGISGKFEPIRCHHFVTETTFGLPVYNWQPQQAVFREIHRWWEGNIKLGRPCVIQAYSLGKAQRILYNLSRDIGQIFVHPAVDKLNQAYIQGGQNPGTYLVYEEYKKSQHLAPLIISPNPENLPEGIKNPSIASASGWMMLRGARRRRNVERGFVLSDHADWKGLNSAIKATGAENIYVTHGYTSIMKEWLIHEGYNAKIVETEYGEEET